MTHAPDSQADPLRHRSLRLARRFRRALAAAQGGVAQQGLTLSDLLALHGKASIATLLMLYALFCLLPVSGVGNVFGVALWVLSWQWAKGRDHISLPQSVAGIRLTWRLSCLSLRGLALGYRSAARFLRPRWAVMHAPWTQPWWAVWIALQALVIFLPVPLGNTLPAFSLVALGLGRLLADGVMHVASLVLGTLGVVYLYTLGRVTWDLTLEAFEFLRHWLP
jgi:hypothetical protein